MRRVSSEVVVPATNFNLTTLAAVKLEFDIQNTDQDVYLESQIARASRAISSYCRRIFAQQTYRDVFWTGWEHRRYHRVYLSHSPVVSGTLDVLLDDAALTDGVDYELDPSQSALHHFMTWGNRLDVTYDAGWLLPGTMATGGPTLPADVEQAAILMVLVNRQFGRLGYTDRDPFLQSETVEGVGTLRYSQTAIGSSSSSSGSSGSMSPMIRGMLEPYVVPVLV